MGKSSIEDKIRDRLLGHEVQLDNEALFDSLGISERNEKNRKLLFWLVSFASLAIVLAAFFIWNSQGVTEVAEINKKEIIDQVETDEQQIAFENTANIEPITIANNTITSSQNEINNPVRNSNTNNEIQLKNSTRVNQRIVNDIEINQSVETQKGIIESSVNHQSLQIAVVEEEQEESQSFNAAILVDINESKKVDPIATDNHLSANDKSVKADKSEVIVSEDKKDELSGIIDSKESGIASKKSINEGSELKIRSFFLDSYLESRNISLLMMNQDFLQSNPSSVEDPNSKSPWAISIMFGYGIFDQQFASERGNKDQILIKEETETPLEYLELGMSVKYYFMKKLYISAGLRFNQYNTKHEYNESKTSKDVMDVEGITRVNIDLYGDTISYENGLIEGTVTSQIYYTYFNSINQWTIPVELGIDLTKNRWFMRGAIGFNTSILNLYDGNVLSSMNSFVEPIILKNSLTFNIQPMLGLGYSITEHSSIAVMWSYNQTIGSLWNDLSHITKQNKGYGLRLVCDYRF